MLGDKQLNTEGSNKQLRNEANETTTKTKLTSSIQHKGASNT